MRQPSWLESRAIRCHDMSIIVLDVGGTADIPANFACTPPEDENVRVWRYMTFIKLMSLLDHSVLYFVTSVSGRALSMSENSESWCGAQPATNGRNNPLTVPTQPGKYIDVSLPSLIESVHVAPPSPDWVTERVRSTVAAAAAQHDFGVGKSW